MKMNQELNKLESFTIEEEEVVETIEKPKTSRKKKSVSSPIIPSTL